LWVGISPLLMIGGALQAIRSLRVARKTKGSSTATAPLFVRWLLHKVGARPDPNGAQIFEHLPSTSSFGCWMVARPLLWASRMTGHTPRVLRFPSPQPLDALTMIQGRTAFFDQVVENHRGTCTQLVVLGAGFDSRAWTHGEGLKVFEVDAPATQHRKHSILKQLDLHAPDTLFVEVDFREASWLDTLCLHGFDRTLPTMVLWEGVTYYLPESAVHDVLRACAQLAQGSVVAFDYFSAHWVHPEHWRGRVLQRVLVFLGEPWVYGMPIHPSVHTAAQDLLNQHGLSLEEHQTFGPAHQDPAPFGGLVLGSV
jgi:methyltransferase (TIGR00027 family)